MGFLDRLIGGLNKVDDLKTDVEYGLLGDHSYDRADSLAARGGQVEGRVTGIRYRYNDTTEGRYRLEWGSGEVAAIQYGGDAPPVLRLGAVVPLRVESGVATLDSGLLGIGRPGRRSRSVPDPGVRDDAMDMRVLSRLKKWPRQRGVVESVEQCTALGMLTQNWDVRVRRADGGTALVARREVPAYVRWYVAPGADVPLAVDPGEPGKAEVDWVALAVDRAGGTWRDHPLPGSIAELALRPPEPEQAVAFGTAPSTPVAQTDTIEGVSIQTLALIEMTLVAQRVHPRDYDAVATAQFDVPEGRFGAIKDAWQARMNAGDWQLGAAYGEAVTQARKDLKKRR